MNRNFEEWLAEFKDSISNYKYYVDFAIVYEHVEKVKVELNILNSLIGSKNINKDFENIITKYPETLKCIPLLLAVRQMDILAIDEDGEYIYNFKSMNYNIEQYKIFMEKTGLFNLIANHLVNNLVDYALGVETGLNSNGRKNRGGHLMEDLVESYIKKSNVKEYYKEMYLSEIENKWNISLDAISGNKISTKRFDFVVKTDNMIYAVETNFYASSGSKLNETARSYKMIAEESKDIKGFTFVWFTDGMGWNSAKKNLQETFNAMEHIYNIRDMENEVMNKIFK